MADQLVYFLIDANVWVADAGLRSHLLGPLQAAGRRGQVCICVTESVLTEVSAVGTRAANELNGQQRQLDERRRRLGFSNAGPSPELDARIEGTQRASRVRDYVSGANGRVLAYPDVQHRHLVERAAQRHPPFDDSGSGYRDALLWESAIELANETGAHVCLVSADGDFGKNGDPEGLNSALRTDRNARVTSPARITRVKALWHGVREHLPEVLVTASVAQQLTKNPAFVEKVKEAITEAVLYKELTFARPALELDLPVDADDPIVENVDDVYEIEVVAAVVSEDPKLHAVSLIATIEGGIGLSIRRYDSFGDLGDIVITDPDFNETYVEASVTRAIDVSLEAHWDGQSLLDVQMTGVL